MKLQRKRYAALLLAYPGTAMSEDFSGSKSQKSNGIIQAVKKVLDFFDSLKGRICWIRPFLPIISTLR